MKTIQYADKTSHWENWWHDYKYGAFYIFPPEKIMKSVDQYREKFDPKSASICRAHISLSEPLNHPITLEEVESLTQDLKSIPKFEIIYGPIGTHPPYPGVTFAIYPKQNFSDLRTKLHSNKIFEGVKVKRSEITPHMTIAEFITMERTNELMKELKGKVKGGKFYCNEIVLAVPNNNFYFEPVLSIPLNETTSI